MKILLRRLFLSPFALFYLLVVSVRNYLYNKNYLPIQRLPCPVISIGNITAGGTGKTPFTIALCHIMRNQFKHIVVLSRGYGRSSKGARIVSLKGDILQDVWNAGDEPFFMAKSCDHVSVVVSEKRFLGYNLIKEHKPDLVILDDGFQHRSIYRDVDIVLNNGFDPMEQDALIPMGRLREPLLSLRRASFICNTKKQFASKKYSMIDCTIVNSEISPELPKGAKCVLVIGVANSHEVLMSALKLHANVVQTYIFKDHIDYRDIDLNIPQEYCLLTTAKDYDKLHELYPSRKLYILEQNYLLDSDFLKVLKTKLSDLNQRL